MVIRLPVIDEDGEVGDLSEVSPELFKPASEVLPPELFAGLVALKKQRATRGAQKAPVKKRITIRLSHDVVERFQASGSGWQTRVDAALKDWLKNHSPA